MHQLKLDGLLDPDSDHTRLTATSSAMKTPLAVTRRSFLADMGNGNLCEVSTDR